MAEGFQGGPEVVETEEMDKQSSYRSQVCEFLSLVMMQCKDCCHGMYVYNTKLTC